jgi:hypothetical protein
MQPARVPGPVHAGKTTPAGRRIPPRRSPAGDAASRILLVEPVLEHAPKRRTTVLLLCLLLGWMGSHRFYVGKRRSGRLYLLTGGLMFVGVFVDLVLILAGSFEDRFGQPLV